MSRGLRMWLATAIPLLTASPLLAQDGSAVSYSWFRMFLWSDDLIGLLMIWAIILMSAVSIGLMIKFLIDYRRVTIVPEETQQSLEGMLSEKRYREAIEFAASDPSYLGKVVSAGLNEASNGYGAMERAIEETGDLETTRLLRPIEYLNVLGNIAPMMGLFGTVYGMIVAFQKLVESGGKPDPAKLAAGISTALVTTFWGLVVAIPALSAYALIRNRIDAMATEGLLTAEDLIKPFKPGSKRTSSSAGAAGGGAPAPRPRPTTRAAERR